VNTMNQDLLQWLLAILMLLAAGAAVTYTWMKFIDLILWLTRNVKPKETPTTTPSVKL